MTEEKTYTPPRWVRIRALITVSLLLSLFALLAWRAFGLQVRDAERYKTVAAEQYLREIELPPRRGRILDRNGAELAASAEVDSVYANARVVGNRAGEAAHQLAEALHADRKDLETKLRSRRYFAWLKRRVAPEEARAVRELEIAGVGLAKEPRRYYPNRALAGPILGWAGLDAVGIEGLELQYDRYLRGARAAVPGLRDALGREVLVAGLGDTAPQAGHDVHTTLDRFIQFRLEQSLQAAVAKHHAKAAASVALDARNGEILAMAAVPTLNPNEPDDARARGVRNRAVTDPFEPGSTMKLFSITGAVEAGLVKPDDHFFCENGRYTIGPATIHDTHPIADATVTEVLAKSSNICTAKIAGREGRDRLHEILTRFGFARPTGVDLPGERAGQLRGAARMGPVETATIAFGQGMTATPLQVAAGYAAIAAGGLWRRPHAVRSVVNPLGQTVLTPPVEERRVVDEKIAATMKKMLWAVTQKGGTGESLKLPGYSFAGKTGTAQKVDPVTRHYSTDKWASSFVGFAPLEDPRIVLFVMIDEPQGTHYGSMVAGPVFTEVVGDALRWLGVPPDQPLAQAVAASPPSLPAAKKSLPNQVAVEDEADEPDENDGFVAASDDPRAETLGDIPDFTGMSVGEALQAARRAQLRVEVAGSGLATAQSPGPGRARRGTACRILFSPPG